MQELKEKTKLLLSGSLKRVKRNEAMSNSGCLWNNEEDLQLVKLYVKYKLNTSLIADIHKRSIKSIELRVIKLGLPIPENNNFTREMAIEQDKLQKAIISNLENKINELSYRLSVFEDSLSLPSLNSID